MPVSCLLVQDTSLGQAGIAKAGVVLFPVRFFPFMVNPDIKLTWSLFSPVLVTLQK